MPTHNTPGPDKHHGHGIAASGMPASTPGYETSDVKVTGIIVFLVSLGVFLVIFFVFCFGMGKVINNALVKHDGPPNQWNSYNFQPNVKGKNLESNAAMEQKQLRAMTTRFPTPQLQMDDGNQDLADLHAREDLLLDHYTWVNQQQGAVRIPIEQAMQLIAQRGLPVVAGAATAPPQQEAMQQEGRQQQGPQPGQQPLMIGDELQQATAPLTNGFARSGYEQELQVEEARQQQRHKENKPGEQAKLTPLHP